MKATTCYYRPNHPQFLIGGIQLFGTVSMDTMYQRWLKLQVNIWFKYMFELLGMILGLADLASYVMFSIWFTVLLRQNTKLPLICDCVNNAD